MNLALFFSSIALAAGLASTTPAHGAEVQEAAIQVAAVAQSPSLARQAAVTDAYADSLRSILQRTEHYPTSREARQLRPQGTARIWLELEPGGQLVGAGIEQSSSIGLLDSQALQAARRATYPAFAASSGAHRRFVVPVEFRAAAN